MTSTQPHTVISAPLLAPPGQGNYRSAGIHSYISQTLRHLPELVAQAIAPAVQFTLFAAHPPLGLDRSINVQVPCWNTDRPAQRILWEQLVLPVVARHVKADVLHATAFVAPIVHPAPTVITIYDLSFALFPQFFRGFNQTYLRLGTRLSARRAQRLIAISDCTRRDVHRLYNVPLDRIDVAYPGVDETLRPPPPDRVKDFRFAKNLPEKYLLFLGTLEPRKNLIMLVRAFTQLKQACPEAMLVLAGGVGWLADDVFAAIDTSGVKESIMLPGYVAAEDKALWYAAATAFVYPSIYEGFGLPPLEAMACGTPVIVSNAASLPEVVGHDGLLIAPEDVNSWAAALTRVWNDAAYRAELADRGRRQAARFTWLGTARQTLITYQLVRTLRRSGK
jgi:glycosyltransferase involved in cell wall biosynthesis